MPLTGRLTMERSQREASGDHRGWLGERLATSRSSSVSSVALGSHLGFPSKDFEPWRFGWQYFWKEPGLED